jgi:hypothetical protein
MKLRAVPVGCNPPVRCRQLFKRGLIAINDLKPMMKIQA